MTALHPEGHVDLVRIRNRVSILNSSAISKNYTFGSELNVIAYSNKVCLVFTLL